MFNVTLTKIDAAQKAKAIREVKAIMPAFNLVEVSTYSRSGIHSASPGGAGAGLGGRVGAGADLEWV